MSRHLPVIGILGGGQLAKMLSQAAVPLGITVKSLVHKRSDALPGLTGLAVEGDWNQPTDALRFAQSVDVVTLENEFVNVHSLKAIEEAGIPLFPGVSCIHLIQDKWCQKLSLKEAGIPVVPCEAVNSTDEVRRFARRHGWPLVLKRRHQGYDGKGNATIRNETDLDAAWDKLTVNENGLYVEAFCSFDRELAVMVCRSASGETVVYPIVDTVQKDHICHIVRAPSSLSGELAEKARRMAVDAVIAVGGVGTVGVEMFLTAEGGILVNEMAPRVHNSGHYTIEACHCSQFENHIRAVMNLPLGSPDMRVPAAVMINLLGDGDGPAMPDGLADALRIKGAHIHLYGKSCSAKGRKMGHVTALGRTMDESEHIASTAAALVKFGNPSHAATK